MANDIIYCLVPVQSQGSTYMMCVILDSCVQQKVYKNLSVTDKNVYMLGIKVQKAIQEF